MSNLEKAKEIVKANYRVADCGIFNSRNIAGDSMETIYKDKGLTIDICYSWSYFEVFGLSDAEFIELERYYDSLGKREQGMTDGFEFTLHSPLTKEDWNKLSDVEHENTMLVTFQTPQGRQVRYIKCEVLNKIRAEIEEYKEFAIDCDGKSDLGIALQIIDKYKAEIDLQEREK